MLPCRPIGPDDPDYDQARAIRNVRFDLHPSLVWVCCSKDDVKSAVNEARARKQKNPNLQVRIKAGGHHHEGMCSGENAFVIDVSQIDHIRYEDGGETVAVGPGAKNADIYWDGWLQRPRRLLNGGGCGDVRIGGLVQGGGWSPYSRAMGLTCDSLKSVTMILADGSERTATPGDDLFRAVSGGGGGNFGVAIEFKFRTRLVDTPITAFTLSWSSRDDLPLVVNEWRENFPGDHHFGLTSFCRLTARGTNDAPVVVAGNYLGDQDLRDQLERLLPESFKKNPDVRFDPVIPIGPLGARQDVQMFHPEYQPGPPPASGSKPDLSSTCGTTPFPHKISSAFPSSLFDANAVELIRSYIEGSEIVLDARRYLSLHCLGGVVPERASLGYSSFAFGKKPFLLQYQAWWQQGADQSLADHCLQWIARFRDRMQGRDPSHSNRIKYTEGGFINFPDRDLIGKYDRSRQRELMAEYYGDKLGQLIATKNAVDPGNLFDFEMGIPMK